MRNRYNFNFLACFKPELESSQTVTVTLTVIITYQYATTYFNFEFLDNYFILTDMHP